MPGESLSQRRHRVFKELVGVFPPGKVVDLGSGHGSFARDAARMGWDVTAVDARDERFPKDGRIRWVVEDIRDHDLTGYDVIMCLGLFYHLTLDDQLDLLQRAAGIPMIVDTHVNTGQHSHVVTATEQVGDYRGCWYTEPGRTTSSWGNDRSFWPTLESLHRMLSEVGGYRHVQVSEPWIVPDRTFFLCR